MGANLISDDRSVNFAIYSKHATRVTLLLFSADELEDPCLVFEFDYLQNKSGSVWHCRLSLEEIGDAKFYGYQIEAPPKLIRTFPPERADPPVQLDHISYIQVQIRSSIRALLR